MPTSSQARILCREDISNLFLSARSHQLPSVQGQESEACLYRTSRALSLPRLFRSSRSSSGAVIDTAIAARSFSETCPRRLPVLESRVPHLIWYPSVMQNGTFFNVSNNWPGDVESSPNTSQEKARKGSQERARKESGGETSKRKKPSLQHRKSTRGFVSDDVGRRQSGVRMKRKSRTWKKSGSTDILNFDSTESSESPKASTLEVNLLASKSSSEYEDDNTGMEEPPAATDMERDADAEAEAVAQEAPKKPAPKLTIKSLYKQLLSIGLSANAFRGVMVENKEGEMKNASEQEAGKALDAMASDMVGMDADDHEESEEEDDDVELIMGSLLSDVGHKGCVKVSQEEGTPERPPAPPQELPRTHAAHIPTIPTPLPEGVVPPAGAGPVETNVAAATETCRVEPGTGFLAGLTLPVQSTAEKTEAAARIKPEPSSDEKAFLQSVAAGAAFKAPDGAKKAAAKAVEKTPKKKVYKMPPVRLRLSVPAENPHLLCIRTPNVDLTHDQVKNMLEAQLGNIVSLQHDPEYIQTGDLQLAPRAMWIFKMEDTTDSNYIRICMDGIIGYDGETLRIRKRDDVHKEENRAYLLVKQIKDEQNKRMKNRNKERKAKQSATASHQVKSAA